MSRGKALPLKGRLAALAKLERSLDTLKGQQVRPMPLEDLDELTRPILGSGGPHRGSTETGANLKAKTKTRADLVVVTFKLDRATLEEVDAEVVRFTVEEPWRPASRTGVIRLALIRYLAGVRSDAAFLREEAASRAHDKQAAEAKRAKRRRR